MRISGGFAKGRKVGPKRAFASRGDSDELRPTAAKVRQAIFNIIAGRVEGSRFLDLYAGTGAVGIEALSRGVGHVVFVEGNATRIRIIRDLLDRFGFSAQASVVKADADSFLKRAPHGSFDIIFLDPPYATGNLASSLAIIDGSRLLKENGIVIAEHSSKTVLPAFRTLRFRKSYRYGDTALSLYDYSAYAESLSTTEGKK
ncbi:MAG TPA: 16S rRNA (guanine(966)-N(2))-methyltransferase RsmD [Dissulfurispiraceae bacterium]|nr:16S rRNA (guanine(966)-N(2))-methyltransferase RsmD [Dissulfurispiraceae bacterium]